MEISQENVRILLWSNCRITTTSVLLILIGVNIINRFGFCSFSAIVLEIVRSFVSASSSTEREKRVIYYKTLFVHCAGFLQLEELYA